MNKKRILYYVTIAIASILVVAAFVTARNYTQLAIAVIFYPVLIYFILKAFPRRQGIVRAPAIAIKIETPKPKKHEGTITDIDKREFLKLIGITGLSFFIFSLFKKPGLPLIGNQISSSSPSTSGDVGTSSNAPAGYRISEIDGGVTTYYGFTNDAGAWLIMREETETSSFRYAKGSSNFPSNWGNRTNLKYDYYYNLF